MRIAVLGATGGTGKAVIQQALSRGWELVALVRSPEKLNEFNHDKLQVVKADIFNGESLAKHMGGCEAVVSCIGISGMFFPWSTVTVCGDSIKSIVDAMRATDVTKVVVMSSWCTHELPDNPKVVEWLIKPMFLKGPAKDFAVMEDYLREQEDMQYTSVKCPQLNNGKMTSDPFLTAEGEHVPDGPIMLARADVARFLLDTASSNVWNRKLISIATK